MLVLGIESTAHTLGIGITDGKEILANEMDTYKPFKGGIIPREAAEHHQKFFVKLLERALEKAGIKMEEIELIAASQGPGIGAPLRFGFAMGKYLSARYNIPFIGVNHPYAHIKIGELFTGLKGEIVVYVSGGNTQILYEKEEHFYEVLGETLDIGVGNLFDSFMRNLDVEYAHGSLLEKLAEKGKYIELPYTVKGLNLTFSGLYTAAVKALTIHKPEDVAYSLMETTFSMIAEVAERAFYLKKAKGFLICGGVAQNKRLKEMFRKLAEEDNTAFGVAPDEFNRDNGGMIAYAGYLLYKSFGTQPLEYWEAMQDYRIDKMKEVFGYAKRVEK